MEDIGLFRFSLSGHPRVPRSNNTTLMSSGMRMEQRGKILHTENPLILKIIRKL
jgi:hypothetical protein